MCILNFRTVHYATRVRLFFHLQVNECTTSENFCLNFSAKFAYATSVAYCVWISRREVFMLNEP